MTSTPDWRKEFDEKFPYDWTEYSKTEVLGKTTETRANKMEDIKSFIEKVEKDTRERTVREICDFIRTDLAGISYADAKYVADDIEHHLTLSSPFSQTNLKNKYEDIQTFNIQSTPNRY